MSTDTQFTPRSLSASAYVQKLFEPAENVAILVRNRVTRKTVQRITKAATVSKPEFQDWLAHENAQMESQRRAANLQPTEKSPT
jgi:hypothetical protein